MRVDGSVPGCTGQVFVFPVGNVLSGSNVPVFLCQAKVDHEEFVAMAPDAHQEVIGLDVAVDEGLVVYVLNARDHLVGQHQHGFHREAPVAKVEQVLQTWPEQIHHHHVVIALNAVPNSIFKSTVRFAVRCHKKVLSASRSQVSKSVRALFDNQTLI